MAGSLDDNAFVTPGNAGNSISSQGTVTWAWSDDQATVYVRVTLDIPSNVQRGNYPLTVSVENTSGATANDAATVTVQDCPVQPIVCNYGDSSGNVPLVGLQNAIGDFVQNNINLSELQAVIDDLINS